MEVAPCDSKGKEYTEADDKFVDSPGKISLTIYSIKLERLKLEILST